MGLHDGYLMGQLAWKARGNQSRNLHNHYVDIVNEMLNKSLSNADAQAYRMSCVESVVKNSNLPPVLQVNKTTGKWIV